MKRCFYGIILAFCVASISSGVARGDDGNPVKVFSPGFRLWGSYHYLSMSDWNSFRESINREMDPGWDDLPSFHHGFVFGGEFSALLIDMLGFGVGTGLILGKGVDYEDSRSWSDAGSTMWANMTYKHSARALPFLFTLYFAPRVHPLARLTLGGGAGFYLAWTNFDTEFRYRFDDRDGIHWIREFDHSESDLSGNGLGIHGSVGLEIKIPGTPIAIFTEGRARYARISGFEGERDMIASSEGYMYGGYYSWSTHDTDDVELKYGRSDGFKYFGPLSREEEIHFDTIRDGVIDFGGFEFSVGISFRF